MGIAELERRDRTSYKQEMRHSYDQLLDGYVRARQLCTSPDPLMRSRARAAVRELPSLTEFLTMSREEPSIVKAAYTAAARAH